MPVPRVHWMDVPRTAAYRLIVGRIPVEDTDAPLSSPTLKEVSGLVARVCSKLMLKGRYAVELSRVGGLEARISFEDADDAHRFAAVLEVPHPFAQQQATFTFDPETYARLEKVGGPPDATGKGRRQRDRKARGREVESKR